MRLFFFFTGTGECSDILNSIDLFTPKQKHLKKIIDEDCSLTVQESCKKF